MTVRTAALAVGTAGPVALATVDAVLDMVEALEPCRAAGAPCTTVLRLLVDAVLAHRACEHNAVVPPTAAPQQRYRGYGAPSAHVPSPPERTCSTLVRLASLLLLHAASHCDAVDDHSEDARQLLTDFTTNLVLPTTPMDRVRTILAPLALRLAQRPERTHGAGTATDAGQPARDAHAEAGLQDPSSVVLGASPPPPSPLRPAWVTLALNVLNRIAGVVETACQTPKTWTIAWTLPAGRPAASSQMDAEVTRFLRDPVRTVLTLQDAKPRLVEMQKLLHAQCPDVTCTIDPRSPRKQCIIITKRLETYRRACAGVGPDLDLFHALAAALPSVWTAGLPALPVSAPIPDAAPVFQ